MSSKTYVDWFGEIAKQRGLPEGWRWHQSEWRGNEQHGVFIVKGGVNGAVFTRGKNKGKPNPAKRTHCAELIITRDDLIAIKARWERETGKCAACCGDGRVFSRWSKDSGTETVGCAQCNETGKAQP